MLLYHLSIAGILARSFFQPRTELVEPSVLRTRAWPHHCDYLLHINNAEYLTLMDYGRTKYFADKGLLRAMYQSGYGSLVAGTAITYRSSIDMFDSYELHTSLYFHDDDWLFFEQIFQNDEGVPAVRAVVRVRITKDGEKGAFADLARDAGFELPTYERPADIASFEQQSSDSLQRMREI